MQGSFFVFSTLPYYLKQRSNPLVKKIASLYVVRII